MSKRRLDPDRLHEIQIETNLGDDRVHAGAEAAFRSYASATGGLTWDGKPIPPFSAVGTGVQRAWRRAFVASVRYYQQQMEKER